MISGRNFVWLIPFCLFLSFPLWKIPVTAFLTPRGGYNAELAERKLDTHNFNMDNAHITQSENGKTTLEIVAQRAYSGKKIDEFKMEEVDAVVTNTSGDQTFVTARRGILDKRNTILTLIDEVVVMKPTDQFELYTDLLIYNDKSKIAQSPGKTQVIGKKIEVRGNNLIFNTVTEAYDLSGRVRCTLANFSSPDDVTQ